MKSIHILLNLSLVFIIVSCLDSPSVTDDTLTKNPVKIEMSLLGDDSVSTPDTSFAKALAFSSNMTFYGDTNVLHFSNNFDTLSFSHESWDKLKNKSVGNGEFQIMQEDENQFIIWGTVYVITGVHQIMDEWVLDTTGFLNGSNQPIVTQKSVPIKGSTNSVLVPEERLRNGTYKVYIRARTSCYECVPIDPSDSNWNGYTDFLYFSQFIIDR